MEGARTTSGGGGGGLSDLPSPFATGEGAGQRLASQEER